MRFAENQPASDMIPLNQSASPALDLYFGMQGKDKMRGIHALLQSRNGGRRIRRWAIVISMAAMVALSCRPWFLPRVISVCVFSDPAYRDREGWSARLDSVFQAVSSFYERTARIRWKMIESKADPWAHRQEGIDARRTRLLQEQGCKADLLLLVTGAPEGRRSGSVIPFSHAAVIVQAPQESDFRNTLRMAHELAHLFGAEHSQERGTLMAEEPERLEFDSRTAKLIGTLREYDFAAGVDGLQGSWEKRVLTAIENHTTSVTGDGAAHAHRVIGTALASDGRMAGAIGEFRMAIQANPANMEARYTLAIALVTNSEPDAAIKELREAIRVDGSDPRLHGVLGALLARRGDRDEAVDELTKAVHADPGNAVLYNALGSTLVMQTGRIDGAIEAFQEAARLNPRLPGVQQSLDRALAFKQGLQAEAARQRRIAQINLGNADARCNVGIAEMRAGDFQAAAKEFEASIRLDPKHGQAHANLALVLYLSEDYAGAWREITKAQDAGVQSSPRVIDDLKRRLAQSK